MQIKVDIKQNKALFKDVDKAMQSFLEAEISATIEDVADNARAIVAVKDGFLKSSIVSNVEGLNGEVRADKHYAPYVEFGTGGLVDVPTGVEGFAIKFKGQGIKQVNQRPQPFMFPAFFSNVEKLKKRLQTKLEKK